MPIPPELSSALSFSSKKQWRAWLEKNHSSSGGEWLIFYKKHIEKKALMYDDAVEESLCFGWIDSTLKRVDGEMHIQRFSPRRKGSVWSVVNKKRVRELLQRSRMVPAGLKTLEGIDFSEEAIAAEEQEHRNPVLPIWMKDAITNDKEASVFWDSLAPGQKKQYIWWITTAKREETRARRLGQLIDRLRDNKKPGVV